MSKLFSTRDILISLALLRIFTSAATSVSILQQKGENILKSLITRPQDKVRMTMYVIQAPRLIGTVVATTGSATILY